MSKKSDLVRGMGLATSVIEGLMGAIQEEGGGEEVVHRLVTEEGQTTLHRMAKIAIGDSFPIWTRIRLGRHYIVEKLIEELESNDVYVTGSARDMSGQIALLSATEHDFIKVSVRDLGFSERTWFDQVCDRAREFGFKPVPQDAALYVALQAGDKIKRGERLDFAMESITDLENRPSVFDLRRLSHGGLRLGAHPGSPAHMLYPGNQLVFSRA